MSADEDVTAALTHCTGERLGQLVVLVLDAVSRTHPDLLREALGRVFDLSAVEEQNRVVAARQARLWDEFRKMRAELRALRKQLFDAERALERFGRRPEEPPLAKIGPGKPAKLDG